MNLEEDSLTTTEEKSMIQSGYLTRDGEKLYLPEIIRHALGFRYERGARSRVLSLLLKHYGIRSYASLLAAASESSFGNQPCFLLFQAVSN